MKKPKRVTLTYSGIKDILTCQRRYYWSREEGLRPIDVPAPLTYGSLVHEFLDLYLDDYDPLDCYTTALDGAKSKFPTEGDVFCKATATCMAYGDRFGLGLPFEVLDTEVKWVVDMGAFDMHGRVDGVARKDGKLYILEHKTASKIDERYVDGIWRDLQVSIYGYIASEFLEQKYGEKIEGVIYNVLQKPTIRRLGITKKRLAPEADDQFHARCMDWYEKQGDDAFHVEVVPLLSHQREDVLREVIEYYFLYEFARSRNFWPRNTQNCNRIGLKCPFLSLCDSGGTPAQPGPIAETMYEKR